MEVLLREFPPATPKPMNVMLVPQEREAYEGYSEAESVLRLVVEKQLLTFSVSLQTC